MLFYIIIIDKKITNKTIYTEWMVYFGGFAMSLQKLAFSVFVFFLFDHLMEVTFMMSRCFFPFTEGWWSNGVVQ